MAYRYAIGHFLRLRAIALALRRSILICHLGTVLLWLSNVPGLGPDPHVMARNLDANMMKPGASGNVIPQVVLLVEFGADLPENRCDGILFWNIKCAATADVG